MGTVELYSATVSIKKRELEVRCTLDHAQLSDFTCIHSYTCACTHLHTYIHTRVYMQTFIGEVFDGLSHMVRLYMHTFIHLYTRSHTYLHTYIYTHIYM